MVIFSGWKKIIGLIILSTVLIFSTITLFYIFKIQSNTLLFYWRLSDTDFQKVTSGLQNLEVPFSIKDDFIYVKKNKKNKILMLLAEAGKLPEHKFKFIAFTEYKSTGSGSDGIEARIKSIEEKLADLFTASSLIKDAKLSFLIPEWGLFVKESQPLTVRLFLYPEDTITLNEHEALLNGIVILLDHAIDGNIHILIYDAVTNEVLKQVNS